MKRLFGTSKVPNEDGDSSPTLDRISIACRFCLFAGVIVTCGIVAGGFQPSQKNNPCLISATFDGAKEIPLSFGNSWECNFVYIISLATAVISALFTIIGVKNFCEGRIK